jgi:probable HAF family extracellular repeat protein
MTDLGALLIYSSSEAHGMNDAGQVVGFSYATGAPYYEEHPFLYSGGELIDLGTLGGHDAGAWAINNRAQIVGVSELKSA